MRKHKLYSVAAGLTLLIAVGSGSAYAEAICKQDVRVMAQPRQGLDLLVNSKDEFKALSGASYQIDYLNENDRRAKSKVDASTVGRYNVYYIDEANVALFASSKWVLPLLDYYPKEYDYDDFDAGLKKVATFDGIPYFAPLTGGGDLMIYRKDLLEKAGLQPPKTLDEFIADVKKLHDPANGVFGVALRGQRGSGYNVWRWMPYFRGFGGKWFDGDKPAFNSEAAVKATQVYLDLFKYSAPGTKTGSWDEDTGAFLAGQVALIIESSPLGGEVIDPRRSKVVGKVGFAAPPTPLTGGGYSHGFAISAKGNKDDAARKCAGLFIAWATSKENEKRRLDDNEFGEINRTSVMSSPEFNQKFGADLGQALIDTSKVTAVNFWQDPEWPALGDHWGISLEELIAGTRTDIKGSLDDLETFANQLIAKRK